MPQLIADDFLAAARTAFAWTADHGFVESSSTASNATAELVLQGRFVTLIAYIDIRDDYISCRIVRVVGGMLPPPLANEVSIVAVLRTQRLHRLADRVTDARGDYLAPALERLSNAVRDRAMSIIEGDFALFDRAARWTVARSRAIWRRRIVEAVWDPKGATIVRFGGSMPRDLMALLRRGHPGSCVVRLRIAPAGDAKAATLDALARAFQFPSYFGRNWDTVDECLRDLTWLPATGYACIFDVHAALKARNSAVYEMLMSRFEFAERDRWRPKDIPFRLILPAI